MTAEQFRLDRENRGLSQKGMADLMGVTEDVVRSLEAGRLPQPANRLKVAEFYKTTITDLWPLDDRAAA